jgi:hypothetical protein
MDRGVFMRAVAEYRMHAVNCRELANLMAKPSDKEIFERLAQAWLKLAELRKRDREPELEVFDKIPFSAHEQRA